MKSWTTNKNLPVTRQTAFLVSIHSPTYLLRLLWIVYDSKDRIFEISIFLVSDNVIILSLILFRRVVRLSSLLTLLGGSSE